MAFCPLRWDRKTREGWSWLLSPAAAAAKSFQSCPTLCDLIDSSPPGSPVPGILQATILEWVAISFSNAWKWKVKVKLLSLVRLLATPWTAAYQTPPSMGFSWQEWGAISGSLLELGVCYGECSEYASQFLLFPFPCQSQQQILGYSPWELGRVSRGRNHENVTPLRLHPSRVFHPLASS